jgi:hypothetical protein
MKVFWREVKIGQRLVLTAGEAAEEVELGGVRETKRGFDGFAKTFTYDPGRAQKGMETLGEAKAFVESFSPWDLYPEAQGLTVDPDVRPPLDAPSA